MGHVLWTGPLLLPTAGAQGQAAPAGDLLMNVDGRPTPAPSDRFENRGLRTLRLNADVQELPVTPGRTAVFRAVLQYRGASDTDLALSRTGPSSWRSPCSPSSARADPNPDQAQEMR